MAEFLIKATSKNWMDTCDWQAKGVTQEMYDARGEKGDIVQVLPDGQKYWFNNPPQYVLIKIPQLNFEKAKQVLEKHLLDDDPIPKLRKKRLYRVPTTLVDQAITNGGILTLTKNQAIGYIKKRSLENNVIVESSIALQEFV